MNEEQRVVQQRLRVLEHAQKTGNVRKTCRYFGIGRSSFYRWKRAFDRNGESGLVNKPRVARNHPNQLSKEVVDRVLYLRKNFIWVRFVLFGIWLAITLLKSVMPLSIERSVVMV